MRITNNNFYTNKVNQPHFGAIFKINKLADTTSDIVIDVVKSSTIPEEAEKIEKKFFLGGGELYVFVPNENLQKLAKKLNSIIRREYHANYITRVD